MKKLFTIFCFIALSLWCQADVYYLLPRSGDKYASELTTDDAINAYMPTEDAGGSLGQVSPERRAYEYFKSIYGNKNFITIKDIESGNVLESGDVDVTTLWINVDRVGYSLDQIKSDFNGSCSHLSNFVKEGGNLYLSKQATLLVKIIERAQWWPNDYQSNGYGDGSDEWQMTMDFCTDGNHSDHAIYKYMENGQDPDNVGRMTRYPLTSGVGTYRRTNNNNGWGDFGLYAPDKGGCDIERRNGIEDGMQCYVLGGFGHTRGMDYAGLIEFYPTGNWEGTVIAMGLAAYQWGAQNTSEYNVKNLTKGILEYLISKEPIEPTAEVTWTTAPIDGIIGSTSTCAAMCADATSIKYTSSNSDIASVDESTGVISYNYVGEVTITANAYNGNKRIGRQATTIHSTGGNAAGPFAYVLTMPLNRFPKENVKNVDQQPDYNTAKWFYDQYIGGIGEGAFSNSGCFVAPSEMGSINSNVKVVWINIDQVGLDLNKIVTSQSDGGLGLDATFQNALKTFINNGNNVLLTKQATRLICDIGRYTGSGYTNQNGIYDENEYEWFMGNTWFSDGDALNRSTHAIYGNSMTPAQNMGLNPQLLVRSPHTDHNCYIATGDQNRAWLNTFEANNNCQVLGDWYNSESNFNCAAFVEFFPTEALKGTIIMFGIAAYQWTTANTCANLKTLTKNILYYLDQTQSPTSTWGTVPNSINLQEGVQTFSLENKPSGVRWTSSDETVATVALGPTDPTNQRVIITPLKVGTTTITATRYGDGYNLPKNISETEMQKTLSVHDGDCGTCFPVTF